MSYRACACICVYAMLYLERKNESLNKYYIKKTSTFKDQLDQFDDVIAHVCPTKRSTGQV